MTHSVIVTPGELFEGFTQPQYTIDSGQFLDRTDP
jgi:hypothetical protein